MKLLIGFFLTIGLLKCSDELDVDYAPAQCTEKATVVDYSGMDGCGLLLQLADGKLLSPLRLTYVQAPTREEDPIYHYQLVAGEKVLVAYRAVEEQATACMAGETVVFISCIRSADEK
jgi:hypothetical protein